jgi:hypothetical protein
MKRVISVVSLMTLIAFPVSCSKNVTQSSREVSARPRVEQRALSGAINKAMEPVDFSIVMGKKVFVETHSLAKTDKEFITAYVQNKVAESGGVPVGTEGDSELKILNMVKVSGTDEIQRTILTDQVRGQFEASLSFMDIKNGKVLKIYNINGQNDETR